MKKLLLVSLLLLALVFTVVACTGDTGDSTDTTVAETVGTTEEPTAAPTDADEEATTAEEPTEAPADTTADPTDTTAAPAETTQKPVEKPTDPPETEPVTEPDPNAPISYFGTDVLYQSEIAGSGITSMEVIDNYVRITPSNSDPNYYPFKGVTGGRYIAIKYRSANAEGTAVQLYIGSAGTGPSDDTSMLRLSTIADGEWHIALFDTQSLIDAGIYDGSTVAYLRFDPLECDYILDAEGNPQQDPVLGWLRNPMPEGAYIDVQYIAFFNSAEAAELYDCKPAHIVTPEHLESQLLTSANVTNGVLGDGFITLTGIGADGWIMAFYGEEGLLDAKVALLVYRTTDGLAGEFFAGSGAGPVGGSEQTFSYTADGAWHGVIVDLNGLSDMSGSMAYIRYDYFLNATDCSIDVQYIALFDTVAQAEAYYAIKSKTPDTTLSFTSDIAAQTVGTAINQTDLPGFWQMNMPTGGSNVIDFNGQPAYEMGSINEMLVMMDGAYYVKANVLESNPAAALIVRGYQVMNADGLVADTGAGVYNINNFYETDGNTGTFGGAGIYARVDGSMLYINLKVYNPDSAQRVGNQQVLVEAPGTELTIVDDGSIIHFLVDGKKYAEIIVIGTISYEDITGASNTGNVFAAKAIVKLADGSETVIENTLVAPTYESHVAIAARAGIFKFSSLEVGGASAIAIPEMEVLVQRVNVSTGKPVSADSVENETNIPSNATDGDESTRWGAFPTGDANMIVDLEQIYKVDTITAFFENSVLAYTVSVSTDGENYTEIYAGDPIVGRFKTIHFEPTDVRFVKFTRGEIPAGQGSNWFSIWELYVYAVVEEDDTPDQPDQPEIPVEPNYHELPIWNGNDGQLTHISHDVVRWENGSQAGAGVNTGDAVIGDATTMLYAGWVGALQEIASFGYKIGDNDVIWNDGWANGAEQAVIDAAASTGATHAARFGIPADVSGIEGTQTISFLYKAADGSVVCLTRFDLVGTAQ